VPVGVPWVTTSMSFSNFSLPSSRLTLASPEDSRPAFLPFGRSTPDFFILRSDGFLLRGSFSSSAKFSGYCADGWFQVLSSLPFASPCSFPPPPLFFAALPRRTVYDVAPISPIRVICLVGLGRCVQGAACLEIFSRFQRFSGEALSPFYLCRALPTKRVLFAVPVTDGIEERLPRPLVLYTLGTQAAIDARRSFLPPFGSDPETEEPTSPLHLESPEGASRRSSGCFPHFFFRVR